MLDSPLDAVDVASGMLAGTDDRVPLIEPTTALTVREAIEGCVMRGLERPPCFVSFSGGKDSSSLLALAVHLAHRHGLPAPIPATILGRSEDMEEGDWQDLVLGHLEISDRWTYKITEEYEALGPVATQFLSRHGLRYPWNVHFNQAIMIQASGGSLISGAGGDELFSPWQWARAAELARHPGRVRPGDLVHIAGAVLPNQLQGYLLVRRGLIPQPWLTPAGRRAVQRRVSGWIGADYVSPSAHLTRWLWRSRYIQHGMTSMELLGADHNVLTVSPFTSPEVIAAFARDREQYSFDDRGEVMLQLFWDLLPEEALRRESKARFDSLNYGPCTAEFVRTWEPKAIDMHLVDAHALRRMWDGSIGDFRSLGLLKQEWLAQTSRLASG